LLCPTTGGTSKSSKKTTKMSSESVRKARSRLAAYPGYLAACSVEAAAYAKCVAPHMGEVKMNQCQAQFEAFKTCVVKQAKAAGKKL